MRSFGAIIVVCLAAGLISGLVPARPAALLLCSRSRRRPGSRRSQRRRGAS